MILVITVIVWTIVVGRTMPVPRKAHVSTSMANCSASAGMSQSRYVVPASTTASLTATEHM
jgi:hypothetical protein